MGVKRGEGRENYGRGHNKKALHDVGNSLVSKSLPVPEILGWSRAPKPHRHHMSRKLLKLHAEESCLNSDGSGKPLKTMKQGSNLVVF